MKRFAKIINFGSLLLTAFGATTCGMLLAFDLRGATPACGNTGCATVLNSAVSRLLGVPLSAYGLIAYVLIAISVATPRKGQRYLPVLDALGMATTVIAAGASALLLKYAANELKATCIWCLASAASFALLAMGRIVWSQASPDLRKADLGLTSRLIAPPIGIATAAAMYQLVATGAFGVAPSGTPVLAKLWPGDGQVLGNPKGRYRCIAVVDFTCPSCQQELLRLLPIVRKSPDLGFAIRNINIHGRISEESSALAQTALRQGKYWAYVEAAARCRPNASRPYFEAAAKLGMGDNVEATDLAAAKQDDQLARDAGLMGAPVLLLWDNQGPVQEVSEQAIVDIAQGTVSG